MLRVSLLGGQPIDSAASIISLDIVGTTVDLQTHRRTVDVDDCGHSLEDFMLHRSTSYGLRTSFPLHCADASRCVVSLS